MKKILACLLAVMVLVLLWAIFVPEDREPLPPEDPASTAGTESRPDGPSHTAPESSAESSTAATASGTESEPPADTTAEAPTEATTEPTTVPTTQPPTEPPTEPPLSPGEKVAKTARAQIDKPYAYGGTGPNSFDTSGLVYYCFTANGISAPRGTTNQYQYGTAVAFEDLEPGDVVFFWTDTPGTAQFVGLYVGDDQFVSASSTKGVVRIMNITSTYYVEHYVAARRFID